jgi:hypothetical protein
MITSAPKLASKSRLIRPNRLNLTYFLAVSRYLNFAMK